MARKLQIIHKGRTMKNKYQNNIKSDRKIFDTPMIKITHYENDRSIKTETFPIIHFLDNVSKGLKKISYN